MRQRLSGRLHFKSILVNMYLQPNKTFCEDFCVWNLLTGKIYCNAPLLVIILSVVCCSTSTCARDILRSRYACNMHTQSAPLSVYASHHITRFSAITRAPCARISQPSQCSAIDDLFPGGIFLHLFWALWCSDQPISFTAGGAAGAHQQLMAVDCLPCPLDARLRTKAGSRVVSPTSRAFTLRRQLLPTAQGSVCGAPCPLVAAPISPPPGRYPPARARWMPLFTALASSLPRTLQNNLDYCWQQCRRSVPSAE